MDYILELYFICNYLIIIINWNIFQEVYPWLFNLHLNITKWKDCEDSVVLEANNVPLFNSLWETNDVHLMINNCFLDTDRVCSTNDDEQ